MICSGLDKGFKVFEMEAQLEKAIEGLPETGAATCLMCQGR